MTKGVRYWMMAVLGSVLIVGSASTPPADPYAVYRETLQVEQQLDALAKESAALSHAGRRVEQQIENLRFVLETEECVLRLYRIEKGDD